MYLCTYLYVGLTFQSKISKSHIFPYVNLRPHPRLPSYIAKRLIIDINFIAAPWKNEKVAGRGLISWDGVGENEILFIIRNGGQYPHQGNGLVFLSYCL